eukprot:361827_1
MESKQEAEDIDEGTTYTINDQNKVLILTQYFFRVCTLHSLFPIEINYLILSYSICPLHYAEFSLIRSEKEIPSISTLTNKNKIKQTLLKKLTALSTILTKQKSYLNRSIDNMNIINTTLSTDKSVKQYQNELYDKCRLIKENM